MAHYWRVVARRWCGALPSPSISTTVLLVLIVELVWAARGESPLAVAGSILAVLFGVVAVSRLSQRPLVVTSAGRRW